MKKLLILLVTGILLFGGALAEPKKRSLPVSTDNVLLDSEDWSYVGSVAGGVTYPIPSDCDWYEPDESQREAGILSLLGNEDCMVQMRVFQPEQLTFDDFHVTIAAEPTAEVTLREEEEGVILCYRNTAPTANGELYGIAMTGLDGLLYKISVFTGRSEDFSPEAPVWTIAETIARYIRWQDFSEWPTPEARK